MGARAAPLTLLALQELQAYFGEDQDVADRLLKVSVQPIDSPDALVDALSCTPCSFC